MAYSEPNLLPVSASTFEGGTSTWSTNGTNCTTAISTAHWTGTYGLRVTATAAGGASAWGPRVPVNDGYGYVARIPIGISTSQNGLQARAHIEWWTAATGGTNLATVTGPWWAVSSTVGFWSANAPVAIGTAPDGATHALVKIEVNGLAAGASFLVDDVYMGHVAKPDGTLLLYKDQSAEQDTSGWLATNGTLSRVPAELGSGTGYYALGVTSSGAGPIDVRTNPSYSVSVGQEYVAYALLRSTTASLTGTWELRWFDGGGGWISSEQRSNQPLTLNATVRAAIVGKAPPGAARVKVAFVPQATAAGQTVLIDDVSLLPAPNAAGNRLPYEAYSTESQDPKWTAINANLSRMYFTSTLTDGYYAMRVEPTSDGVIGARLDTLAPVSPGTTYQVRAVAYRHNPTPGSNVTTSFRTRIDWCDSNGNVVLYDDPDQFYANTSSSEWYGISNSETRTCPVGATHARAAVEWDHTGSAADYYVLDNVSVVESAPEYTLETDDEAGAISLGVFYAPTSNADLVSVYRMDEDGQRFPLRGYGSSWEKAPYTGPFVVEDYEAPLGQRAWYSIQWYAANGTAGARLYTRTVNTPTLSDGDYVWFKSPGLPASNTTVMMQEPPSWARAARSTAYEIVGRTNPVHVTGKRGGRKSTLTVTIWDDLSNTLFNALLDSGLPSLIQAMPGYGIDGNLYVSVGDVEVESLTGAATEPGWRWTLNVSEIDRPEGGIQGSALETWQGIYDAHDTWGDLFESAATWTEVLTGG